MGFTIVLMVAAGAVSAADNNTEQSLPPAQHLLVQVVKTGKEFKVVRTTLVKSALPKQRSAPRPFAWRFKAVGVDEQVLFLAGLDDPTLLRGEFQNPGDPTRIDAVFTKMPEPVHFTIRLPLLKPDRLDFFAVKPEFAGEAIVPEEGYQKLGSASFPRSEAQP